MRALVLALLFSTAAAVAAAGSSVGMSLINAGAFQMGDAHAEGEPGERPVHTVAVGSYYIDVCLVTKALWDDVAAWAATHDYDISPEDGQGAGSDHPVQYVNWYEAVKWANARSEKEGLEPCYTTDSAQTKVYRQGVRDLDSTRVKWSANGYRLPTEAEWEKAARAGASGLRFPWTDTESIDHTRANYESSATFAYDTSPTRGRHPEFNVWPNACTSPVTRFPANAYGLFDMAGNLASWCWDWYDESYYAAPPADDPHGPSAGEMRIHRGGCWGCEAGECRVAARAARAPNIESKKVGIRLVRASPSADSGEPVIPVAAETEASATSVLTLVGHGDTVLAVAFSPDGQRLASGSKDASVRLWDSVTGELACALVGHSAAVTTLAFAPDGKTLASGSEDGTIKLWDPATGQLVRTIPAATDAVVSVGFSPDGKLLASGSETESAKLWDPASGGLVRVLSGSTDSSCVAFSPRGDVLAVGSGREGMIRFWAVATGQLRDAFPAPVVCLAFSPNGEMLATGDDIAVTLWDAMTGIRLQTLAGHTDWVWSVAFSPDGGVLASGSHDGTAKVWAADSGQLLRTITGHAGSVRAVAFSPDGLWLASASSDKTIRVTRMEGLADGPSSADVSPVTDGTSPSAIADINAFLADCPPDAELAVLKADFAVIQDSGSAGRQQAYACAGQAEGLSQEQAIYQALRVIRHMRLSEPLPWTSLHPYEWLKSKIGAIVIDSSASNSYCCTRVTPPGDSEPVAAIVMRDLSTSMSEAWRVWIDRRSGTGLCGLVGLIFHEARHADAHHSCKGTEDATLEEMGAWGVQYTVFHWIADGRIAIGLKDPYDIEMTETHAASALSRICD